MIKIDRSGRGIPKAQWEAIDRAKVDLSLALAKGEHDIKIALYAMQELICYGANSIAKANPDTYAKVISLLKESFDFAVKECFEHDAEGVKIREKLIAKLTKFEEKEKEDLLRFIKEELGDIVESVNPEVQVRVIHTDIDSLQDVIKQELASREEIEPTPPKSKLH
jgi:hypothetical protein